MKKKGKDNTHNYSEIARMMGLRHYTTPPPVGKLLKPKPITQEDEDRVAKKLAEYEKEKIKRRKYYKGYKNRKEYLEASEESRTRREIIFGRGAEKERMEREAYIEWVNSKKPVFLDIKTPGSKDNDRVDDHVWQKWSKQDRRYYKTFNLLWNKGILKDGALNPLSYKDTVNPKYDYRTNGTHYKGIDEKKIADQETVNRCIQEIKKAQYAARNDVMNGHIDFSKLTFDQGDESGGGDEAHEGFNTRWIEENIGTEHPDEFMRTEGLIDVSIAKGLAEHDGIQTALLYLSNVYAEEADFNTPHLVYLNCVRFATSVAQITAEARRRNNRAKFEKKKVNSLADLDKIVNSTSERVATYANTYTRKLEVKYKGDYKVMIKKVIADLQKSLDKVDSNSPVAYEMIFINYGLILASLFKKVNNKRTKNERKN